jgi:hypothetical protein
VLAEDHETLVLDTDSGEQRLDSQDRPVSCVPIMTDRLAFTEFQ